MGKKQTIKLLKQVKKKQAKQPSNYKSNASVVTKKQNEASVSSKLNRQQKLRKRQRFLENQKAAKSSEDSVDPSAAVHKNKRKASVGVPDFDVEASNVVNKKKKKSSNGFGSMDLDEFLAGGFANNDDSSSDDEASSSSDEMDTSKPSKQEEMSDDEIDSDASESNVNDSTKPNAGEDSDSDNSDEDQDELAMHKRDLENLKNTDPEFYKHLRDEANDLLEFNEDSDDDSESDPEKQDEAEDDDEAEEQLKQQVNKRTGKAINQKTHDKEGKEILTIKTIKSIETQVFDKKSLGALRTLVQTFKSGCHISDTATISSKEEAKKSKKNPNDTSRYAILSSSVYQHLMVLCVSKTHTAFNMHSFKKKSKNINVESNAPLPSTSNAWKNKLEPIVKSFLNSYIHLLNHQSTDDTMLLFLLKSLKSYNPYIACFKETLAKKLLKTLTKIISDTENTSVSLTAFLRIHELSLCVPKPFNELCLKSVYLMFVRNCKFSNERNADSISLQAKYNVELFGIDLASSYQLGFVYIRQLALHLRSTIASKTVEAFRSIYSWQFLHCLRVWGAVLSAYSGESVRSVTVEAGSDKEQLRALIYPLTQVIIGVVKLVPTPRNFAYRLHCIPVLIQLARTSRMYIPILPLLLDILTTPELFNRKPAPSTAVAPNLEFVLKFNKQQLQTAVVQDLLVSTTLRLIRETLDCYRYSISFPELVYPTVLALRTFQSKIRVGKWRGQIRSLLSLIEEWSSFVDSKRMTVDFGPSDVARMNCFLAEEEEVALVAKEKNKQHLDVNSISLKQRQPADVDAVGEDDEDSDDDNLDDDSDDEDKKHGKKQKQKSKSKSNAKKPIKARATAAQKEKMKQSIAAMEEEDVVQDLQLSDSDDGY